MDFKKTGRYSVPLNEDYEPGAEDGVLKNILGLKTNVDIESVEEQELKRTEVELLAHFNQEHKFTVKDLCNIHDLWLSDVYEFAGEYRSVNMAKDDFMFAAADLIPSLMKKLEENYLAKYTPCHCTDLDELAYALGIVHVEFIIIHPFRDGNGRVARLLADLMCIQANRPSLLYDAIDQDNNPEGFEQYILAIHAGFCGDYELIQSVFKRLLTESK